MRSCIKPQILQSTGLRSGEFAGQSSAPMKSGVWRRRNSSRNSIVSRALCYFKLLQADDDTVYWLKTVNKSTLEISKQWFWATKNVYVYAGSMGGRRHSNTRVVAVPATTSGQTDWQTHRLTAECWAMVSCAVWLAWLSATLCSTTHCMLDDLGADTDG